MASEGDKSWSREPGYPGLNLSQVTLGKSSPSLGCTVGQQELKERVPEKHSGRSGRPSLAEKDSPLERNASLSGLLPVCCDPWG